jgi:hypothetical protein
VGCLAGLAGASCPLLLLLLLLLMLMLPGAHNLLC